MSSHLAVSGSLGGFCGSRCHHVLLVLGLLLTHCCGLQSQGHGPMADSSGLEGFAHMGLINDLLA